MQRNSINKRSNKNADEALNCTDVEVYTLRNRTIICITPKSNAKEIRKQNKIKKTELILKTPNRKNVSIEPRKLFVEDDSGCVLVGPDSVSSVELNERSRTNIFSASPLSQINEAWHWKKKLNWLEKRRDVGVYIQCCNNNCLKWRYCDDYHDPTEVPELWFCHYLEGLTCQTREEVPRTCIRDDLIENKYNAGSLVWARYPGYPWWPAMVCDSPETLSYYQLKKSSIVPTKYHVIYFTDDISPVVSWLCPKNLKSFIATRRESLPKKMVYNTINYTNQINRAYEIAMSITRNELTISERLQQYSVSAYYGRYSQSSGSSILSRVARISSLFSPLLNSDDEIPGTTFNTPPYTTFYRKNNIKRPIRKSYELNNVKH